MENKKIRTLNNTIIYTNRIEGYKIETMVMEDGSERYGLSIDTYSGNRIPVINGIKDVEDVEWVLDHLSDFVEGSNNGIYPILLGEAVDYQMNTNYNKNDLIKYTVDDGRFYFAFVKGYFISKPEIDLKDVTETVCFNSLVLDMRIIGRILGVI